MIGGMLLVLLLGPVGFIIAMCIGNDDVRKGALLAGAIYLGICIISFVVVMIIIR